MSDETAEVTVEVPVVEVQTESPNMLGDIMFQLSMMREEWNAKFQQLQEQLANQEPSTVVQVETTVEAPETKVTAADGSTVVTEETPTETSLDEPIAEATADQIAEAEAATAEADSVTPKENVSSVEASDDTSADAVTEVEATVPPPEKVTAKKRGKMGSLFLGRPRSR